MKDTWGDCDVFTQAKIIAFNQVSEHDEAEQMSLLGRAVR